LTIPPSTKLPALEAAADAASGAAQRTFLRLNIAQLALLSTAAFLSGLNFGEPARDRPLAWTVCGIMFVTLCVSTALRVGKFDDRWFRCRACAENLKSIAWRFVMTAPSSTDDAVKTYLSEVQELRERLADLEKEFIVHGGAGDLITAWMRTTQSLSIASKAAVYRKDRLEDQVTWYSGKAVRNARFETLCFWFVFGVEFVAILCAAYQAWQLKEMNVVGGVASIGTALIAWSQIKRFSDLDTSYAIAAGDLQRIGEVRLKVETQEQLDLLVQEVETAVSREHSMWLARRVTTG
jgi:hypothetical protein